MDDARAVMDAAGSERAALVGVSEGGPLNLLFAATHPDRTGAMVIIGTYARIAWAPDYPYGTNPTSGAPCSRGWKGWGKGVLLSSFAQSLANEEFHVFGSRDVPGTDHFFFTGNPLEIQLMTRGSLAISCVPRVWRWSLWALALVALYGCVGVSPRNVVADRMDYGQVVADSWKRQALLNVVRLRYADAPVFLDVSSIINSYTIGGNANAQATLPSGSPNVLAIGGTGSWSNTPTVTYQPLMGDRFTKSLLQSIPPVAIFQLLQGGWPVELVLRTSVNSINGLQNDRSGIAASSGFDELVDRLSRLQAGGEIGLRVEARPDGSGVIVVMRSKATQETLNEDGRRVRELLGLSSDITEFDVVYGLVPRNQREVALLSRSMLEIMLQLGHGIELPATHEEGGWVLAGQYRSGERLAKPLVNIHSGSEAPANAYAAVPYLGYWYWIDQADIASKRTFTFLMILFSLAETGPSAAAPVVTVPSR